VQTSASELGKGLLPARSCPDVSGGAATEDYITDLRTSAVPHLLSKSVLCTCFAQDYSSAYDAFSHGLELDPESEEMEKMLW
jgi:hypothetical protein